MKDRIYVTIEIEHHKISEVKGYWLEVKAREAERAWKKRMGFGEDGMDKGDMVTWEFGFYVFPVDIIE